MTDPTQVSELRGAPLAQAVCEYITAHPEEWNQDNWGIEDDCGTTARFAGWTLLLTDSAWFENGILAGSSFSISEQASLLLGRNFGMLFYWNPDEEYRLGLELNEGRHEEEARNESLSIEEKLCELWHRVARYYSAGEITIPEEYR